MRRTRCALALAALVLPSVGATPATGGSAGSLEAFAESMFGAVGSRPTPCTAPDEADRRFCAQAEHSPKKLKEQWERGIEGLSERIVIEPVTDWQSVKMLHWRYYVVDEQPIVVQFNRKSHSLQMLGSAVPRCETSLADGMFSVETAGGDVTPPRVTYSVPYAWAFRAHRTDREGEVKLIGTVSAEGGVRDLCLDVLEPPIVDLALSAVRSVREWRFKPALVDGKPTRTRLSFPFELRPDEAQKVVSF